MCLATLLLMSTKIHWSAPLITQHNELHTPVSPHLIPAAGEEVRAGTETAQTGAGDA